ncbi:MAG: hypothetical protein V7K55_25675 [Nostoc sp.]|uniref:hypothetical protein n=1 Tax=Nostoc sp. TaxID=1180 RepID=UPI002FF7E83B
MDKIITILSNEAISDTSMTLEADPKHAEIVIWSVLGAILREQVGDRNVTRNAE